MGRAGGECDRRKGQQVQRFRAQGKPGWTKVRVRRSVSFTFVNQDLDSYLALTIQTQERFMEWMNDLHKFSFLTGIKLPSLCRLEAKCSILPHCYLSFTVEETVQVGFLESALRLCPQAPTWRWALFLFKYDDLG